MGLGAAENSVVLGNAYQLLSVDSEPLGVHGWIGRIYLRRPHHHGGVSVSLSGTPRCLLLVACKTKECLPCPDPCLSYHGR